MLAPPSCVLSCGRVAVVVLVVCFACLMTHVCVPPWGLCHQFADFLNNGCAVDTQCIWNVPVRMSHPIRAKAWDTKRCWASMWMYLCNECSGLKIKHVPLPITQGVCYVSRQCPQAEIPDWDSVTHSCLVPDVALSAHSPFLNTMCCVASPVGNDLEINPESSLVVLRIKMSKLPFRKDQLTLAWICTLGWTTIIAMQFTGKIKINSL